METTLKRPSYFYKIFPYTAYFLLVSILSVHEVQCHGSYSLVETKTLAGPASSTGFLASLNKFAVSTGSKLRIYQASDSAATFQSPEYDADSIFLVS